MYRIQIVKPTNYELLKNRILNLYQNGGLKEKIKEGQLIMMLEQLSQSKNETKITFKRRSFSSDEDD